MTTIKVENQELINYMESLSYEVSARRDIIAFMLDRGMDTSKEQFAAYQKEYNEFYAKLEMAKAQFERECVRPVIGDKKVNWNLDYGTAVLTITEVK